MFCILQLITKQIRRRSERVGERSCHISHSCTHSSQQNPELSTSTNIIEIYVQVGFYPLYRCGNDVRFVTFWVDAFCCLHFPSGREPTESILQSKLQYSSLLFGKDYLISCSLIFCIVYFIFMKKNHFWGKIFFEYFPIKIYCE